MTATCACPHCGQLIEFEAETVGAVALCPTCGKEFTLALPGDAPPVLVEAKMPVATPPPKSKPLSKIIILSLLGGICIPIAVGLIWMALSAKNKITLPVSSETTTNASQALQPSASVPAQPQTRPSPVPKTEEEQIDALRAKPLLMSSEEKTARDNILKSLLDIQSSTAIGVTYDRYGDILSKALSTVTFEKTKLSTERHQKFLLCVVKAIDYYHQANAQWSDYFKYDWMREENKAIMSQSDFDDFRQNGLSIDTQVIAKLKATKECFMFRSKRLCRSIGKQRMFTSRK